MAAYLNEIFPKEKINIECIIDDIKQMHYSQIKQFANDFKTEDKALFTHHKKLFDKFIIHLEEIYPIDGAKTTYEEDANRLKRKPLGNAFCARRDKYNNIINNNKDLITEAINNRVVELQETALSLTKFDKKAYLNAPVVCECGQTSYRKHLSRHKSSALHEKRMNILNSL